MNSAITTITPAAEQPVTLAEFKTHLRLLGADSSHDTLLANLIGAATSLFESQTQRAFVTRTLRLHLDGFPSPASPIYLPKPPAIAVASVKYLDTAGAQQTLSSDAYQVDAAHVPARVTLKPDQSWPDTKTLLGAVTIDYTAGYGAASAVPQDVKAAILMLAQHWYDNPSAATSLSLKDTPMAVQTITQAYAMPTL